MQDVRNDDEVWATPLLHHYTTGVKHRTRAGIAFSLRREYNEKRSHAMLSSPRYLLVGQEYPDAFFFPVEACRRLLCRHDTGGWLHRAGTQPIQPSHHHRLARRASVTGSAGFFERCGAGAVISCSGAPFVAARFKDKRRGPARHLVLCPAGDSDGRRFHSRNSQSRYHDADQRGCANANPSDVAVCDAPSNQDVRTYSIKQSNANCARHTIPITAQYSHTAHTDHRTQTAQADRRTQTDPRAQAHEVAQAVSARTTRSTIESELTTLLVPQE